MASLPARRALAAAGARDADRDRDRRRGWRWPSTCRSPSSCAPPISTAHRPAGDARPRPARSGLRPRRRARAPGRAPTRRSATALLDQRVVAGIGNVFRSEVAVPVGPPSRHGRAVARRPTSWRGWWTRRVRLLRANARPTAGSRPATRPAASAPGEACGSISARRAVPPLRHADPIRRPGRRAAPRLLVPDLPAGRRAPEAAGLTSRRDEAVTARQTTMRPGCA